MEECWWKMQDRRSTSILKADRYLEEEQFWEIGGRCHGMACGEIDTRFWRLSVTYRGGGIYPITSENYSDFVRCREMGGRCQEEKLTTVWTSGNSKRAAILFHIEATQVLWWFLPEWRWRWNDKDECMLSVSGFLVVYTRGRTQVDGGGRTSHNTQSTQSKDSMPVCTSDGQCCHFRSKTYISNLQPVHLRLCLSFTFVCL